MGIAIEEIIRMAGENCQSVCKRPTAQITGIKRLEGLGGSADPSVLYVGTRLPETAQEWMPHLNLLLYTRDAVPQELLGTESNLILVNSLESYHNVVLQLLDRFSAQSSLSDIADNMLAIVRDGGDAKKLMRYAYSLLCNPMMLVDVSFNYVESVGTEALLDEDNWNYAIENKVFPLSYINYIMNSVSGDETEEEIRIEKPDEVTRSAQYSTKVLRNHTVLGYIKLLEKNKPVTDFDIQVFRLLARFLSFSSIEERGQVPSADSLSENFLRSLLDRTLTDRNEIQSRQAFFNIKLYETLYVIVIKIEGACLNNDQIYYTLRKIRSFFSGNIVTWYNNCFVVLYDTREASDICNQVWLNRFTQVLRTLHCTANISTPFHFLQDICNYYRQALFCVELRTLFQRGDVILWYKDIFEYHMIVNLGKQIDLKDLIHPVVAKLMKMEASGENYLLETLFIYNRNHCNISSTAKEMYLHYNTLKHRIERIEELTNYAGKSSRDFFLIALSEKILKVLKSQENCCTAAGEDRGERADRLPDASGSGQ